VEVGKAPLGSLQSIVSLLAGILSISGAMYSAVRWVKPASAAGEIVAVVRAARSDRPVPGTTIEVLTPADALVATVAAGDDGYGRHTVAEGTYHVRVSAPRFVAQTRDVQVQPGTTAEVRFRLATDDGNTPSPTAGRRRTDTSTHPVSRGVGAAERFLHRLGL
jgi:hypothetical protein